MLIDQKDPAALQVYLAKKNWLNTDEPILSLSKPGEGNMNYTLRVKTPRRTLIVKQARGYVEKYPTIAAPAERAVMEGLFYRAIAPNPLLASMMPTLIGLDETAHILILEDLGAASDCTVLYQPGQTLTTAEVTALATYLATLHGQFMASAPNPVFANRAMRALNHEHIFRYPFRDDTGFDLDTVQPGLQALSAPYRNARLVLAAQTLGERYLDETPETPTTLLHGDFYPGSFLRTATGLKVIDPEFCFYGPAEFDLGVLLAHLHLARQPDRVAAQLLAEYGVPTGFDERLLRQFTGIEILRRLIGLAQLPLSLSLAEKEALLEQASALVLEA